MSQSPPHKRSRTYDSTLPTLPYTILEDIFSHMDDVRPLLLVNKQVNEIISRWRYGPILIESDDAKPNLFHIIAVCISSLENKVYESGLAKLLRDPTTEVHLWPSDGLDDERSEWFDQIRHLYSLLCKDIDTLDLPMKLIKEDWAFKVIVKDGRLSEVTVREYTNLEKLTHYLEAMSYLRISLMLDNSYESDVLLEQIIASTLLSSAVASMEELYIDPYDSPELTRLLDITKPKRLHITLGDPKDPFEQIEARHVNCTELKIHSTKETLHGLSKAKVSTFLGRIQPSKIAKFTISIYQDVNNLAAWISMLFQHRQVLPNKINVEIEATEDANVVVWKAIRLQLRDLPMQCTITCYQYWGNRIHKYLVTFDMRNFGGFQKVGKWTLVRKGPDGSKFMTNILKANSTQSQ